ncbi:MAG: 3-deoxy-manno-octulosonate cytidylyltransferase [Proteobacteria bacterium]|jgi:3-deoxy-manno-octulosonate cytidylyltransferase (CMP-KDO synthetase)|nr:3-deoxy-manno-octulosonate cytidylyltransferase [Pseudomonadota bacterium]
MGFDVVIPARWESTRLPGKVLADLAGKPMIQRVYERAAQSDAEIVVVATDNEEIRQVVESFGGEATLTRNDHVSGTDRIAEVFADKRWKDERVVVSVQGDEPFIEPDTVNSVANVLIEDETVQVSTAATSVVSEAEYLDPNVVKVVLDNDDYALYFSRASIPAVRGTNPSDAYTGALRHLGIYGYRVSFLREWPDFPRSALEQAEALEQLRTLSSGYKIRVCQVQEDNGIGVDTPTDLAVARELLAAGR